MPPSHHHAHAPHAHCNHAQGHGRSYAYGAVQSDENIYVVGRAHGNLSLGTVHRNGTFTDHSGTQPDPFTLSTLTFSHHDADTCCIISGGPNGTGCCDNGQDPATTQHGMDVVLYTLDEDGAPKSVYFVDTMPVDGITNGVSDKDPAEGGSVNGGSGGFSFFGAIDSFEKAGNAEHVVIAGRHRGRLSFPLSNGTLVHFDNAKFGERANGWGYNAVVAKIDLGNNGLAWVTSGGMMDDIERSSAEAVATTAAGHVIAVGELQGDDGGQFIVKFDGADGKVVWTETYPELDHLYGMDSVDENIYVTGQFKGNGTEAFGLGNLISLCDAGEGSDAVVFAIDAGGADGPAFTWMTQIGCGQGASVEFSSSGTDGEYLYVAGSLSERATTVTTTPEPTSGKGACTLTGKHGGYLAKIHKDDGKCVWAKDTPNSLRAVSDGDSVWAANYGNNAVIYDGNHRVTPNGPNAEKDMFVAKYRADDGTAYWASAVGGIGNEQLYDMTMTSEGPMRGLRSRACRVWREQPSSPEIASRLGSWATPTAPPSRWVTSRSTTCSTIAWAGRRTSPPAYVACSLPCSPPTT